MNLINILQTGIGKNFSIRLNSIYIKPPDKEFTFFGNEIFISFYGKDIHLCYAVKDTFCEFEDEFDNIKNGMIDSDDPVDYRMETKYSISVEKIEPKKIEALPVRLDNNFFELTGIEVYKKKIGKNKSEYDELNKKLNFAPELYVLKFAKGNEVILFYDTNGPQKNIFYSEKDFLEYLTRWGKSFNDFEKTTAI